MNSKLDILSTQLKGKLFYDNTMRILYATDASAYREIPLAVAIPETENDLKQLIQFAKNNNTSLIPRTAGTSLAGQVVGDGIVVDVSKYFTGILEVNEQERWVRVQPGVIRDDLNKYLSQFGLFFGPETSTSNRCMIGGMVGNNSCGTRSVVYGSTREHTIAVKAILSDGSDVEFAQLTKNEFAKKLAQTDLEGDIYNTINSILSSTQNLDLIDEHYPKKSIPRRNTGYALDVLSNSNIFRDEETDFNFCKLIAGSEGTLCFITEIKLNLVDIPAKHKAVVAIHCNSIDESLHANLTALKHGPTASELMDHYILECTKENIEQRKNRVFIEGDPKAILAIEFAEHSEIELNNKVTSMITELKSLNQGYHYPILTGDDISKVWTLRSAGLGLLSNIPGDAKAVPVIEDTAVDVADLPAFIKEFNETLSAQGLYCVHYAHAGSGELHLRPIIDLKTEKGNQQFRKVAEDIAALVKKYKGSLSGEHGDGRLRGEFIQFMIGEENYQLLKQVKAAFDPQNIFNPGKIVDTAPMDTSLRYMPNQPTPEFKTTFSFEKNRGILRAAELCNGSGDCRKTEISGGTMCPSYMATREEKHTTRARANILREVLTNSTDSNPFDSEEIKEVMDLCLSCKGCKSECPSNVDVAKLKAEFFEQYYKTNKVPFRSRMIANTAKAQKLASLFPSGYNFLMSYGITANLFKKIMGFAQERPIPLLYKTTLLNWYAKNNPKVVGHHKSKVYFFADEFTNFLDVEIGITAIKLLTALGYQVVIPKHTESGRTYLSKGLVSDAKKIVSKNIDLLGDIINEKTPLIGIEPSAILSFRDEYLDLASPSRKMKAEILAANTFLIDEFIASEIDKGNIISSQFTDAEQLLKVHGHCHQKALSSLVATKKMLSLPQNYKVHMIASGCCGMAGSFGYEKEHYDVSMQIGELVLFPTVRKQEESTIIVAPGTSCRHQIKDGTGRKSLHPVEVLYSALKK